MINFWEETIDALKDNGKTFDDVEWIGGDDFEISKENFKRISNFTYDDTFTFNDGGLKSFFTRIWTVGDGFFASPINLLTLGKV